MNKDLTDLKEQYERLGKEIKNLESLDYAFDKLPPGTLVRYWDGDKKKPGVRLLEEHAPGSEEPFKVGFNWWEHIEPAEHPWIGYKPGASNSDTPPVSPDQLVQVCLRSGGISTVLPADWFRWSWNTEYDDIVAYKIIIEEVA
jgi:hypothetical protein